MVERELITWIIGLYERGQGCKVTLQLRIALEQAARKQKKTHTNDDDKPYRERER